MRVSLEWLSDYVDLSASPDAHELAAQFASIGLEEEDFFGPEVTGPLVVARVLSLEKEKHSNGKTINWCSVDVGEDEPRGIVCGAHNFVEGDLVVACLPGAVLPGNFEISARKTYGHVSDGMICSLKELGLGEDQGGIIVLKDLGLTGEPGDDAIKLLGLDHTTLDVNVTPDRGYQLSMRGIAREYALLKNQTFNDPANIDVPEPSLDGYRVDLEDTAPIHGQHGCSRFTAMRVDGIDAQGASPYWMQKRLLEAGMRPLSLVVDITNYVMLELGQPLHAYDADKLGSKITVRRARAGEKLTTLDDVERKLHPEDLLITDNYAGTPAGDPEQDFNEAHYGQRVIGLAGVMGGQDTEVSETTTSVIIEAAHFDKVTIARSARRHKLPSEAARRFERGVDPHLGPAAAMRCAQLLQELAGGTIAPEVTVVGAVPEPTVIPLLADAPAKRVGVEYTSEQVENALTAVGCKVDHAVDGQSTLAVTVPSWRPDLTGPEDLIEEIARVNGYDQIPSVAPQAPGGSGLTHRQKALRTVSNLLAHVGLTEVLTYPFTAETRSDALLLEADDPRRTMVRLANPMADDQPLLRSHLLATLPDAVNKNLGRGFKDVFVFETGLVTQPEAQATATGTFAPGYHPTEDELATLRSAVPPQPLHVAAVMTGKIERLGVWGKGRSVEATDAIDLVHRIAGALGLTLDVRASKEAPFHPGRCAEFTLGDTVVGHAGELHPKAIENLGLPARTCAFEVDLDVLFAHSLERAWDGALSTYPVSRQDVALIVDESVPAADLARALREGAGPELEDLDIFDLYTGDQVGEGKKSIAFRMTFRAADRTLTADEASALRVKATDNAHAKFGVEVRS
ncbi:phenylalanine--tRNA ligase subunit beta [Brevibacterium sp. UMB10442]|nr:phenylalanine--tRNA ligase subunit beta [Brevibacterium sp. UMB10442]